MQPNHSHYKRRLHKADLLHNQRTNTVALSSVPQQPPICGHDFNSHWLCSWWMTPLRIMHSGGGGLMMVQQVAEQQRQFCRTCSTENRNSTHIRPSRSKWAVSLARHSKPSWSSAILTRWMPHNLIICTAPSWSDFWWANERTDRASQLATQHNTLLKWMIAGMTLLPAIHHHHQKQQPQHHLL